jgi:dienelactone hydrolase
MPHNGHRRKLSGFVAALTAVGVTAGLITGATAADASAAAGTGASTPATLYLPRPTGPYQTGTVLLHLVDDGRVDPFTKSGPRELMTQVWYPAVAHTSQPVAPYMPDLEATQLEKDHHLAVGSVRGVLTYSRLRAPARHAERQHPVVLFTPGLCSDRTDDTAVAEQLASLGFVVVATASTHEAGEVEFPGRRLVIGDPTLCTAAADPNSPAGTAALEALQNVRIADTEFVLGELGKLNRGTDPDADRQAMPYGLAGSLDLSRIGMFGHSLGGSVAAEMMYQDHRISAGVDLDGLVVGPVDAAGLKQPFLVFGSDYHTPSYDPSWKTFLPALAGWRQWLRLKGSGHYRFIDLGASARAWGLDKIMPPQEWALDFGSIADHRALDIVRTYTTAFFERFLAHRAEPVLDHPSNSYPEVQFEHITA